MADLLREKLRARGHHKACGGGDSSSASTQNTTNQFSDSRSVTSVDSHADASVKNWTDSSTKNTTTNVTTLDGGAISAALSNNSANNLLVAALTEKLIDGQNKITTANLTMARDLAGSAQGAYSDATMQASGTKNLVMVGMVVVALAATLAFGKN